jgi:hypothetical protein
MDPIELRQERDFSEKINATFHFTVRHVKPLGLCLLYFVSPLTLLAGIANGLYQSNILELATQSTNPERPSAPNPFDSFARIFSLEYGAVLLFSSLAGVLLTLTVYAYLLNYEETGQSSTPEQVWARLRSRFLPSLGLSFLYLLTVLLGLVFCLIPGVYLAIAFSLGYLVLMREDLSITASLGRSYRLTQDHWWSTFGLLFVVSLVAGIAAGVLAIPTYLITFLSVLKVVEETNTFLLILATIVSTTASTLFQAVVVLATAFQYYNLVEKKEGVGLLQRISEIGTTLSTRPRPDEPGEY